MFLFIYMFLFIICFCSHVFVNRLLYFAGLGGLLLPLPVCLVSLRLSLSVMGLDFLQLRGLYHRIRLRDLLAGGALVVKGALVRVRITVQSTENVSTVTLEPVQTHLHLIMRIHF